jgi:lipopolysaccharide export system permease protein
MRILDKYILKQMLGPFCFGVAAFSTIFVASSFLFRVAQYLTEYGASTSSLIRLFFCLLPEVINYTFPMSMLLASLLTMDKLSGNSEITAMRSGGISFRRIAAPILIAGFVISMFSVIWAEKVVPPAKAEYARIVNYEIKNDAKPKTQNHIVIKSIKDDKLERLTYARTFDEKQGVLKDITIEEFQDGKLVRIQKTPLAEWINGTWIMEGGSITDLTGVAGVARFMTFDKQILPITTTPKDITLDKKDRDEMTIGELKEYIAILQRQYMPTTKYVMEMYMRFSIPLASFFFALVGVPLGMQGQRSGTSMGLGISVVIIFAYYSIMTFMTGLGNGGALPPIIAAMVPNALCGACGLWLMWRKDQ